MLLKMFVVPINEINVFLDYKAKIIFITEVRSALQIDKQNLIC